MNLWRREGLPIVVGHHGAAAVAPENTLAALQAYAGAQLVEFDIGPDLRLRTRARSARGSPLTLDEGSRSGRPPDQVHSTSSGPATSRTSSTRSHGARSASARSSRPPSQARPGGSRRSRRRCRDRLPASLGVARFAWPTGLTRAGLGPAEGVPVRVPLLIRIAHATVLSLHHTLCSRPAVQVAHRMGVPVLGWTANDPAAVRRLSLLGVDGIVSDDPEMALKTLATLTEP